MAISGRSAIGRPYATARSRRSSRCSLRTRTRRKPLQDALAQLKALFATRQGVEAYLVREVQLFFMLYGWRLDAGAPERYDDRLPNPLGGAALPASATIRLVLSDADRATVRYTLAFDRAKAGKAIADSLGALAARMGKPAHELDVIASSLEVEDESELVFDRRTRWPERLFHERRIRIGDRSRIDRTEYDRRP